MGNRGVICTRNKDIGVYLHWNGGRDSIEAFLKYCKIQGFRSPETDCYGWARLCQVIANFMGGSGLSVGIQRYGELDCDNGDNGLYIIENWEIVDRKFFSGEEQCAYPLDEMLIAIDEKQPKEMQLGEYLTYSEEVKREELGIGNKVWIRDYDGFNKYEVVGFGDGRIVNGLNTLGIPYVNRFEKNGTYMDNINNYIEEEIVRREKISELPF